MIQVTECDFPQVVYPAPFSRTSREETANAFTLTDIEIKMAIRSIMKALLKKNGTVHCHRMRVFYVKKNEFPLNWLWNSFPWSNNRYLKKITIESIFWLELVEETSSLHVFWARLNWCITRWTWLKLAYHRWSFLPIEISVLQRRFVIPWRWKNMPIDSMPQPGILWPKNQFVKWWNSNDWFWIKPEGNRIRRPVSFLACSIKHRGIVQCGFRLIQLLVKVGRRPVDLYSIAT